MTTPTAADVIAAIEAAAQADHSAGYQVDPDWTQSGTYQVGIAIGWDRALRAARAAGRGKPVAAFVTDEVTE